MRRRCVHRALILIFVLLAHGCASSTPPEIRVRQAALTFVELATAIDDAEWAIWEAELPNYTREQHDEVGRVIQQVLFAARAFERAAASVPPDVQDVPAGVETTKRLVLVALDDVIAALPALDEVRQPILAAITALRIALVTWRTS